MMHKNSAIQHKKHPEMKTKIKCYTKTTSALNEWRQKTKSVCERFSARVSSMLTFLSAARVCPPADCSKGCSATIPCLLRIWSKQKVFKLAEPETRRIKQWNSPCKLPAPWTWHNCQKQTRFCCQRCCSRLKTIVSSRRLKFVPKYYSVIFTLHTI